MKKEKPNTREEAHKIASTSRYTICDNWLETKPEPKRRRRNTRGVKVGWTSQYYSERGFGPGGKLS